MFFKIGVLKISQISQETFMLESLSNKVAGRPEGLQFYLKENSTLLFTCEISKFLKTSIFREHHWRLFLCLSNDKTDTT